MRKIFPEWIPERYLKTVMDDLLQLTTSVTPSTEPCRHTPADGGDGSAQGFAASLLNVLTGHQNATDADAQPTLNTTLETAQPDSPLIATALKVTDDDQIDITFIAAIGDTPADIVTTPPLFTHTHALDSLLPGALVDAERLPLTAGDGTRHTNNPPKQVTASIDKPLIAHDTRPVVSAQTLDNVLQRLRPGTPPASANDGANARADSSPSTAHTMTTSTPIEMVYEPSPTPTPTPSPDALLEVISEIEPGVDGLLKQSSTDDGSGALGKRSLAEWVRRTAPAHSNTPIAATHETATTAHRATVPSGTPANVQQLFTLLQPSIATAQRLGGRVDVDITTEAFGHMQVAVEEVNKGAITVRIHAEDHGRRRELLDLRRKLTKCMCRLDYDDVVVELDFLHAPTAPPIHGNIRR